MKFTKKQELSEIISKTPNVNIETFRRLALSINVHPSVFFDVNTGLPFTEISEIQTKMNNIIPDATMKSCIPKGALNI